MAVKIMNKKKHEYHHLLNVQINPLRPNPIHSETGSHSFRFSVKIFSQSALAGGGAIFPPTRA